ncbi:MAG: serine/threonine-protein kinase [Gemmatimonadota bacterium]|nr:serine/threonine-protein kinase [Gemmatimonadota bacterium]MYD60329.1 serine/threonine protein kinase [Gemmatimonadota bacterium]
MMNNLYFDLDALRRGNFFILKSEIRTEEGDPYELEEWIDRGGNAAVFKGRQRITGDECAVKFLMNSGWRNTKRFLREIKLLKSMHGDHITQYYGAGRVTIRHNKASRDQRMPFVVMELADCNLQDVIREEGPLSYERYAGQFRGLASALASLHDRAVHRDIKPENILVAGERWLLSDYGLCTFVNPDEEDLTLEGQNVGPKFWLSPEAHNRRLGCRDEINAASDVFQLAAIFWYVATGRHPTGILTEDDWIGPKKLFSLLHRSLYHDFTKRPQDGQEFSADLVDALTQ